MASDGFLEETSCSTTTIKSLAPFDETAKDGEIRMMVVKELGLANATGDEVATSKDCTPLTVAFRPVQPGSNTESHNRYGTNSDHETDIHDAGLHGADVYEADRSDDGDDAADSGYGRCSDEDSIDEDSIDEGSIDEGSIDEGSIDEGYSSGSNADETDTIPESLTCEENGREYEAWGCADYWGPCDEVARNLHDLSHHVWTLALGDELLTAPVLNPQRILDLGTGTGIWAIDAAEKYPSSYVTGIDVSLMQPDFVPPNLQFLLDDFNAPDYEEPQTYDLIHARQLLGSVLDWPQLIEKCYRALKPGGYLNLVEPSIHLKPIDTLQQNHPYPQWIKTLIDTGEESGMSFDVSSRLEGWLKEAGFVGVKQRVETIPVGGKTELGRYNQARLHDGVFDFSARRLSKWKPEEIMVFVAKVRAEIRNPKLPVSQDFYFVHGQKPSQG